jgi:unsaturated rhamnogalacturonyl hydrolase
MKILALATLIAASFQFGACGGAPSLDGAGSASVPDTGAETNVDVAGVGGGATTIDGSGPRDQTASGEEQGAEVDELDAASHDDSSNGDARSCDGGAVDWGRAVVEATRQRLPTPTALGNWGYQPALFLHGAYLVYKRTGDATYLDYIKAWVDAHVPPNGDIGQSFNSLDNIMPGLLVLDMYEETKDVRYKTAADKIRKRFDTYPRTNDGAFWHNTGLVGQTWGDGAFMALPFLSRYGKLFGDTAYTDDEVVRQLLLYHAHLQHPLGIHYHAWDEQGDAAWTNPQTKHSPESWCRANGWYGMASVEVLEAISPDHPKRQMVIDVLDGLIDGWSKLQDPATGRYWQVIDKANTAGNWLETSCTSMLAYTMSRAVQRGYASARYGAFATKGYQGVLDKVSFDQNHVANVADICIGTDVGDLGYYLSRPRATNDFHGLGAFLIMYEEMGRSCQ